LTTCTFALLFLLINFNIKFILLKDLLIGQNKFRNILFFLAE
jgi:hypothetical protein